MKNRWAAATVITLAGLAATQAWAQHKQCAADKPCKGEVLKAQTVCPIMGEPIEKDVFVDTAGYRFYACCEPCLKKIKANPRKALVALKAKGQQPELHLTLCDKCGEIKGAGQCCKPDAKKCGKCDMNKGSIGCCLDFKAAGQKDLEVCAGCGEIKGFAKCCKPDAKKCEKCSLNKGAPGCCKDLKTLVVKSDIVICPSCGEVKGAKKCCNTDVKKCTGCGLHKGAPGCCKLGAFTKNRD